MIYSKLITQFKFNRNANVVLPQKVQVSLTEDEFVEEVQGSGVLVYLSATWLRELYQQVLATDLLKEVPTTDHPLLHLLSGKIV